MKIQLKHSDVLNNGAAVSPAANQMEYGEVALNYNVNDIKLWTKASDNSIVSIVPTIGNGQINFNAGDGLTSSGDNATANQTGNTTKVLTVQAADNTIAVASGGISVNTGNLGIPTVNNSQIALTAGDGLISVTTGTSTEAATSFTLNSSSGLTNTLKVKLDGASLTAAAAGLKLTSRTLWGQAYDGTANATGAISGATTVTGSDAVMYVQPEDSATSRNLVLRGNNETDNSNAVGGGGVIIGDESRGAVTFLTGQTVTGYQFAKAGTISVTGSLKFDNLTTSRVFTFPNESGTIALTSSNPVLTVNNVSPDSNGDINLTTTNIAGVITSINNITPGSGSTNLTLNAGNVGAATSNHDHGNIGNNGSLNDGGSAATDVPLRTNGSGLIIAGVFASNTSTTAGEFVQASDSRLSDSRVPLSHVHGNISFAGELLDGSSNTIANSPLITNGSGVITQGSFGSSGSSTSFARDDHGHTGLSSDDHNHGNVAEDGKIGTTANLPLITTTGGLVTTGQFGTGGNQFCEGNDSRLSDARTPVSHSHGNITNDGKIGSSANKPIITGASGVLEAGAFGTTANSFCEGNDSRLSDARTPASHSHGNINNDGEIGSTAGLPIITGSSGILQTGVFGTSSGQFAEGNHSHGSSAHNHDSDYAAANHAHGRIANDGKLTNSQGTAVANVPLKSDSNGLIVASSFGTGAGTFCEGNDSRLTAYSLPTASGSVLGGVKVGTNLSINNDGVLSAADQTYTLPTATANALGGVKVGSGLAISNSVLSVNLPVATASAVGGVKVGTRLSISNGVLSADDQSYTLPSASNSVLGGIKVGTNLTIDNNGILSADDQTSHTHSYADAVHSHTIATAASDVLGGIKVGSNLSIDSNGVLSANNSYTTLTATTSVTSPKFIDSDNTNRYVDPAGTSELNNLNCAGNIVATGNVSASSDIRLKSDIEVITDALSKVREIRGVTFKRMGQRDRNAGVIAQEVETVLPEVVKTDTDGFKSVCYGNMIGLLVEAVKELSARLEELEYNR